MDAVISHIIENSKKEGDLDLLKKSLESNLDKIQKNANQIMSALKVLNPKLHSLGITYLLYVKSTAREIGQGFLVAVEDLIQHMERKQVVRAAHRFAAVISKYAALCRDNGLLNRGIKFLKICIEKFRPSREFLTPMHADLLCLCLKAKNFKACLSFLEEKIFDMDPNVVGMTPRDMLLYYYYGGMVYIGLKQFSKAQSFFDTALSIPAYALNAIMVEAFKKYVLVSLLVQGKYTGLSKHASSVVHRHMKTYCNAYVEFANAFATHEMEKVVKVATENQERFQSDYNFGLVKQCIQALARSNIQRLTQTYLTLSLADIAKAINLPSPKEAEQYLLKMIEKGEINAQINQKDGMVSFNDELDAFESENTREILDTQIDKAISLAKRLKFMDDSLAISHTYIARLHGVREDMFGDYGGGGMLSRGGIGRMFGGIGGMFR